jgi:Zn-dependent M28 family amino/carboxypeptidase
MVVSMKKRRVIALSTLAVAAIYFVAAGKLEASRIATPLAGGASVSGPIADSTALMNDVRTLASPAFKGRRTGSEGNKLAQAYITKRYSELGLQAYGASYAMPFSFTQHSIRGLFSAGKKYTNEFPDAANLVGYIKGSARPERVMVVSAHYDHLGERNGVVYPGADDNASGVGAMLATAAYFKQHPPLHTVVFAAFDAEELGLRGSEAFVKALPFPRDQLALDLNFDMVSRSDSNELWVAGLRYSPELRNLVAAAAKNSTVKLKVGHDKPMLLAGTVEDWTASSDQGNFHDAGVPFLYFGVDDHADYHRPTDIAEKINPAFYANVASLLIDVAVMADRNLQMLK